MGWTKVAEVVLQSDADNITIPFTVQNNRLYLILGEGKCDGVDNSYIRFGVETGIPDEFYLDIPISFEYHGQPLCVMGIISATEGNYVAIFLGLVLIDRTNARMRSEGDDVMLPIQVPVTFPVFLRIENGVLKAGYRLIILEKPIE